MYMGLGNANYQFLCAAESLLGTMCQSLVPFLEIQNISTLHGVANMDPCKCVMLSLFRSDHYRVDWMQGFLKMPELGRSVLHMQLLIKVNVVQYVRGAYLDCHCIKRGCRCW